MLRTIHVNLNFMFRHDLLLDYAIRDARRAPSDLGLPKQALSLII